MTRICEKSPTFAPAKQKKEARWSPKHVKIRYKSIIE